MANEPTMILIRYDGRTVLADLAAFGKLHDRVADDFRTYGLQGEELDQAIYEETRRRAVTGEL